MIEYTDPQIKDALYNQREGILVVYVWTAYCIRCEEMKPALLKMEQQYPRATFISIENKQGRNFCSDYAVRWLPSLLIFRRGIPIAQTASYGDEDEFRDWLRASFRLTGGVLEG